MKKAAYHILFLPALALLLSCGRTSAGNGKSQPEQSVPRDRIELAYTETDIIRISFAGEETERTISPGDLKKLVELLRHASYDSEWNESGIMVKMVEPDYIIYIFRGPGDSQVNPEFMFIWKESGRVKYDGLWYLIDGHTARELFPMLDSYDRG